MTSEFIGLDNIDSGNISPAIIKPDAWLNFDAIDPTEIRSSHNISSYTKTASGRYTIAFVNPAPDTNYCIATSACGDTGDTYGRGLSPVTDEGFLTTGFNLFNISAYITNPQFANKDQNMLEVYF